MDNTPKPPRLKFIDMTRSIALLLMIEGHFTGAALSKAYYHSDSVLFSLWRTVHGYTAQLFFAITGLIFVYLLSGTRVSTPYWQNDRVRKGFRRAGELVFWGYLLQIELLQVFRWIQGETAYFAWVGAFHVLQSIGVGILGLLGVYAVYRLIPRIPLYLFYAVGTVLLFSCMSIIDTHVFAEKKLMALNPEMVPQYWPRGYPSWIQNFFRGPFSDFSFFRFGGFVMLGGFVGALVRKFEYKARTVSFSLIVIALGGGWAYLLRQDLHTVVRFDPNLQLIGAGVVVAFIGTMMLLNTLFDIKAPLFMKIGQNTFPVYVVHVIILYGGITGIGLKPWVVDSNLELWQTVLFSATALMAAVLFVRYIDKLEPLYYRVIARLRFW